MNVRATKEWTEKAEEEEEMNERTRTNEHERTNTQTDGWDIGSMIQWINGTIYGWDDVWMRHWMDEGECKFPQGKGVCRPCAVDVQKGQKHKIKSLMNGSNRRSTAPGAEARLNVSSELQKSNHRGSLWRFEAEFAGPLRRTSPSRSNPFQIHGVKGLGSFETHTLAARA